MTQAVCRIDERARSVKREFVRPVFTEAFATDVARGLSLKSKEIPSVWFYDDEGSRIFSRITELPEYYLTRRETEILETHATSIVSRLGTGKKIFVELGAGDGTKTEIVLREAVRQAEGETEICFLPIDVSASALDELCGRMSHRLPGLTCEPMVCDNLQGLAELDRRDGGALCVLFLGSSIGNYPRIEVERQLSELRSALRPGDFALIGFDLVKDPERLVRAYSDSSGTTRDFNLNLLRRMNRELDANFELSGFRHEATWNPEIKGMESSLVSLRDQVVSIEAIDMTVRFREGESIRTEVSLKFEREDIDELAVRTGFTTLERYEDAGGDFTDVLWRVDN